MGRIFRHIIQRQSVHEAHMHARIITVYTSSVLTLNLREDACGDSSDGKGGI